MSILTEKRLIKIMRDTYRARLLEAISESDVIDKRGNIVVQPDLKVRHKDTQLEYTVDHVEGEGEDIKIALRMPDEPRFDPPPEGEDIIAGTGENVLGEDDHFGFDSHDLTLKKPEPDTQYYSPDAEMPVPDEEVEIFLIDKEEFEKEYEVK